MKVMLLSGSTGKKSFTRTFLLFLQKLLKKHGVDSVFWDLGVHPLPIAVPEFYNQPNKNPDAIVRKFNRVVKSVDGFIIGSPLYHGSYSGVLKNALDNLPPGAFLNKPVALVSHSSNARSCVVPCNDLRPVVRSLSGYAIQHQVGTTDDDYKVVGNKISLINPSVKKRSKGLVNELITISGILRVRYRDLKGINFKLFVTSIK